MEPLRLGLRAAAVTVGLLLLAAGGALAWVNLSSPHPLRMDHSGALDGRSCRGDECVTTLSYEGAVFLVALLVGGAAAVWGGLRGGAVPLRAAAALAFFGWIPPTLAQWLVAGARPGSLVSNAYASPGLVAQTKLLALGALLAALVLLAASRAAGKPRDKGPERAVLSP